jgi:hypothetical protein
MLTLEIVYTDPDLIECVVSARRGSFRAATSIYFTSDSLSEFAKAIAGFPSHQGDHREFAAETLGDTFRLQLDTFEATGRCIATVSITDARDTHQAATIRFPVYAGEIDSFERDVRTLSKNEHGSAMLGAQATSAV